MQTYRWTGFGTYDYFIECSTDEMEAIRYVLPDIKITGYKDKYYFLLDSKHKVIEGLPTLAHAFGGMYDELPFEECDENFTLPSLHAYFDDTLSFEDKLMLGISDAVTQEILLEMKEYFKNYYKLEIDELRAIKNESERFIGHEARRNKLNPSIIIFNENVLGNENYKRDQIVNITFLNSLDSAASEAWDIGESTKDNKILAWVEETSQPSSKQYNLYIASDSIIEAPENSCKLFANYTVVENIIFNQLFDTSKVTSMSEMFSCCYSLKRLDVSGFDTSNVSDMKYMFAGCQSLKQLDLSGFDTSEVTNMEHMFDDCRSLKQLDLSEFNTSDVTSMNCMFADCWSLKQLDLSGFDTSNVIIMAAMFFKCESLKILDLSNFNTSKVTTMYGMFMYCEKLKILDISGFNVFNIESTEKMFDGCKMLKILNVSAVDTSIGERLKIISRGYPLS